MEEEYDRDRDARAKKRREEIFTGEKMIYGEKFNDVVKKLDEDGNIVNISMDYYDNEFFIDNASFENAFDSDYTYDF